MPSPESQSSEAFASLTDYESMYGAVPASDRQTITAQLQRASRIVRDELAYAGIDVYAERAAGKIRADTLTDVVCDMVNYSARQQARCRPWFLRPRSRRPTDQDTELSSST